MYQSSNCKPATGVCHERPNSSPRIYSTSTGSVEYYFVFHDQLPNWLFLDKYVESDYIYDV